MANEQPTNYWNEDSPQDGPAEEASQASAPQTRSLPAEDTPDNPPITWSAQEYIHLDRNPLWFVGFALVVVALVAVDVFLLRSWTFSLLVLVMAFAIILYIRRPPRTLTYALSPVQGLYVGERLYTFDEFRSFGLIKDGENHSIMLIPRKRFSPGVSVYFPVEAGERIVDILGQRLPMETLKLDIVDVLVRKLRL